MPRPQITEVEPKALLSEEVWPGPESRGSLKEGTEAAGMKPAGGDENSH